MTGQAGGCSMLEYFATVKQAEIERLAKESPSQLAEVWEKPRPSFSASLQKAAAQHGLACIAEYKRASPSMGAINLEADPVQVATHYARGGAAAISVLTEASRFQGDIAYLHSINTALEGKLPLLRKDFILHPLQVQDTARTPASALLLIVELTPSATLLRSLREQAEELGMEAVVEVFSRESLLLARESGATIIQVNARNLQTMQVDRQHALNLAFNERHTGTNSELWIAASGLANPHDLQEACTAGFDAVLIGTSLMQQASGNLCESLTGLSQYCYRRPHAKHF